MVIGPGRQDKPCPAPRVRAEPYRRSFEPLVLRRCPYSTSVSCRSRYLLELGGRLSRPFPEGLPVLLGRPPDPLPALAGRFPPLDLPLPLPIIHLHGTGLSRHRLTVRHDYHRDEPTSVSTGLHRCRRRLRCGVLGALRAAERSIRDFGTERPERRVWLWRDATSLVGTRLASHLTDGSGAEVVVPFSDVLRRTRERLSG